MYVEKRLLKSVDLAQLGYHFVKSVTVYALAV